jgi:hypothetical protein
MAFTPRRLMQGAGSPAASLEPFNYVTMLLHGNGTNGAQNNTFLDSSTNNFTITRNGNTTQGSFSPYGTNWSNFFDGTGDYLSTPNVAALQPGASTNPFCVECWVYPTSTPASDIAILGNYKVTSFPTNTDGFDILQTSSNRAALRWGYPNYADSGVSAVMTLNTWNHIAVCRNSSGSMSCYLNGTRWFNTSTNTSITNATASSFWVGWAGSLSGTTINPFNGYISNVRLVKGSAVYDPTSSTLTVPTSPLTAVTNTSLLTCQSNRFVDSSASPLTMTPSGNTSVQRFNPFGASTAYSTSVIGGSGYFDGSGDNLSVAANSSNLGTGDFNITFWMYLPTVPNNGVPATNVYNGTSFTNGWYFYTGVGTDISFGVGDATGASAVGGTANGINAWHYVEATRSGSTLSLYLDGVLAQSKTNTNSGTASGNVTRIGARYDGGGNLIAQYITDFKVVVGTAGNTSNYTPPTAPASATGSTLMLSMKNAAIFDNAMMTDLETVGNAQISTSIKKYGTGSLAFDNTGDFLRPPVSPMGNLGGNFTIEFWAYLNDLEAQDFIGTATWANYIGAGQSGWSVSYVNEKVSFSYQNNNSYIIATSFTGTALTNGVWYHIAVVRDNGTIKCYVDGVASSTTISSSTNFISTSYGVWVGAAGGGNVYSYEFYGNLDDVRITNGYARYTANFTPPTAALTDTGPY